MLDYNQQVIDLFPKPPQEGEIGIEIEVEGRYLPHELASYWVVHQEGSLRGADHAEYVLCKPATRRTYLRYLEYLKKKLAAPVVDGVPAPVLEFSPRTSVHVHLNMQDKTLIQVFNLIVCAIIVEDILADFAGEYRVGNVFCFRAKDAEAYIDKLAQFAARRDFNPDERLMRYAAVNVCSIPKFNSIEFRSMRGTLEIDVLDTWIKGLLALKDAACSYSDPVAIMADFSSLGPQQFVKKVLGGFPADPARYQASLWDSLRLAQIIAFASDWKSKEPAKERVFNVEQILGVPLYDQFEVREGPR